MKPELKSKSSSKLFLTGQNTERTHRSDETIDHTLASGSPVPTTQVAASNERQEARKRLLLADDQRSNRDSLSQLLRRQGYNVVLAENGRAAIERAAIEPLDLVLLDLSMPELDGWEAIKRIAALKPGLPVVVITAHSDQRRWVEPSGAWALLEKPLDIPLLLAAIRDLMGPSSASRQVHFRHYPSSLPIHSLGLLFRSGINE